MKRLARTTTLVLLALGVMTASLSGVAAQDDDRPTITVGSKNFTEQLIMGEMLSLILEDAGFEVEQQLNLGGTAIVHEGLVSGDVDVYVEYTGTGLVAILDQAVPSAEGDGSATPALTVAEQTYTIVSEAYPEEFGAVWLEPIGFNNTFGLVVTRETAEEHGLQTISDLEGLAGDMTLGSDPEFAIREDALPGLEETYGIEFGSVQTLDVGLLYAAVDGGDVDISAAASTDGRIPALDLVLLEDDLGFFPPYYAAPVINQELLEEYPELEEILNQLAGVIDNETMANMNYQVDEENVQPRDVARTFLEEQGIIGSDD